MNEELQKELDHDMEFIDKVHERIYSESDDSFNDPEWIIDMTEIANRYLMRFKMAEIGRRNAIKLLDDANLSISKLQKEVHENAVDDLVDDETSDYKTIFTIDEWE